MSEGQHIIEMDSDLYERVAAAVQPGDEIETIANKQINRIAAVDRQGVDVETARSGRLATGPQHVPAWMIVRAWEHLRRTGELSQPYLLNELNVKRSAFVCALLALFPDVVVRSHRPVVLKLLSESDSQTLKVW
ncbi:hypothetical protein [Mycobacterium sp. PSTR-4-N]|uniref:hypothetical protein n=1 Tax=Mycobacterium sp. PSTR-4-N TaxID=2917745 RepID=UPI001F152BDF|nr:hypothetical protein [Mycobacterium sp. PSTR-4-N]MCG7598098.1 hypothetical protein [Mycobacterium sp. PSTR-4-N]